MEKPYFLYQFLVLCIAAISINEMHLGLLTQERLSFDPIKPLILRGPPTETSSSVFTGTVVLSLARATKISSITATFKSTATTYWPEGTYN